MTFDSKFHNFYELHFLGIENLLPKEVLKDNWNLIVAHFLGVDHAGHRYGPFHQEMGRKLSEMNTVIKNLTELMDNETTVSLKISDI